MNTVVPPNKPTDRATLAAIARRAMIERGLEADFPPAAQHELATISAPAAATADVRDLRDRLWASIDNDDSRDLDQLTVAESLAGERVRILVAVADVDALVRQGSAPRRILETPGLDENLRLQDRVAQQLVELRHRHGALRLETLEAHAVFHGDVLADLDVDQPNRAQQLIEDFMIAANSVTATYLAAKKLPSLRRVLRSPERWARIVQLAAGFGDRLPAAPDVVALEAFLTRRRAAAPDKFADLSLAVVKLIGRGEYVLDLPGGTPPGHFGLAVKDYAHSTAPNRRFPDLITQRLLKTALAGAPLPYTIADLTALAQHCTEREDAASKVERRVRKSAAALLLSGRIGESFDAIVTGAADKGTWVRLFHPPTEGRLERGFEGLDVGDHVRVKLIHTDVERGFIDFARA